MRRACARVSNLLIFLTFSKTTIFSNCRCSRDFEFDAFGGVVDALGFDVFWQSSSPRSEVVHNAVHAIVFASACGEENVRGQARKADRSSPAKR